MQKIKSKLSWFLCSGFWFLVLNGCATANLPIPQINTSPKTLPLKIEGLKGIYHRAERGQTLWKISRMYGVELDDILRFNNITDVTQIPVGQPLFIPNASKIIPAKSNDKDSEDFIWPAKGIANATNKGINMRIPSESEVVASRSGTVVFTAENLKGYGRTIIIEHGGDFMTVYTLLSQILVKPGEYINQGSPIARIKSGALHFEIRRGSIPQNPYYYLPH